ncbi:MAG TPA: helix-turn-helix domain-containing protein [Acidimicrobiales bacterium]|nr:helix-turn-helix domain-containing protein [Acidimicrobiales bacterium]
MSPRRYQLGARATAVSETRSRVIAAARELFVEGGFYQASMEEIARRADVARATVYHQFGSKLGVFEAVIADFEDRAGLDALVTVVETAPPPTLLRAAITAGCAYWATDPTLARKAIGLASMQPGIQELLDHHDAGRLTLLNRIVDRLLEAGLLREGCSPEHAIDLLWVLTSFDAYDLLTRGRSLHEAEAAATLVTMAEGQLGGER